MNSHERVWATMEGKPVDRIASDFRAEKEVYLKLREHLRLADDESVRQWAKSDFRDPGFICSTGGYGGYNSFGWKDRDLGGGICEDFWGVRRKKVRYDGGEYVDIVHYPLKALVGIDAIRKYQFPDPRKLFDFSNLPRVIRKINGSDRFFIMIEGESLHDRCWAMRGIEEFMMDLLSDEETALYLIEANQKFFFDYTRMILEKTDGLVDAIGIYNDLGSQNGMLISPATYRKFFKERQAQFCRMVKGFGAKIFYHSCGGITPIIEDLIEIGVDILDPLQFKALNITPCQLADLTRNRICLHGGIDTQELLVHGTPEDIRREIQIFKRELGRKGRYILSGSHLLQVDVPIANIETIVEEIK